MEVVKNTEYTESVESTDNTSKKLSYEELKNVAEQTYQQAMQWKQKAEQEVSRNSRFVAIMHILQLNVESKGLYFTSDQVNTMTTELYNALYSVEKKSKIQSEFANSYLSRFENK